MPSEAHRRAGARYGRSTTDRADRYLAGATIPPVGDPTCHPIRDHGPPQPLDSVTESIVAEAGGKLAAEVSCQNDRCLHEHPRGRRRRVLQGST